MADTKKILSNKISEDHFKLYQKVYREVGLKKAVILEKGIELVAQKYGINISKNKRKDRAS